MSQIHILCNFCKIIKQMVYMSDQHMSFEDGYHFQGFPILKARYCQYELACGCDYLAMIACKFFPTHLSHIEGIDLIESTRRGQP